MVQKPVAAQARLPCFRMRPAWLLLKLHSEALRSTLKSSACPRTARRSRNTVCGWTRVSYPIPPYPIIVRRSENPSIHRYMCMRGPCTIVDRAQPHMPGLIPGHQASRTVTHQPVMSWQQLHSGARAPQVGQLEAQVTPQAVAAALALSEAVSGDAAAAHEGGKPPVCPCCLIETAGRSAGPACRHI